MRIEALWDKHSGETAWIVGTGPSLRLVPREFFDGRLVIGLNQAWRHVDVRYLLTIHAHEPEVVPSQCHFPPGTLITKAKGDGWARKLQPSDPNIYVFRNNRDPHDFQYARQRTAGHMYCGRGIQATALCLAAHMGCRFAVLAGCDMGAINGDHHAHDQHVRFHGLSPDDIYDEYYHCTAQVREICYTQFGMRTLNLTPFLGLGRFGSDYGKQCRMLGLDQLPEPEDTSAYARPRDF